MELLLGIKLIMSLPGKLESIFSITQLNFAKELVEDLLYRDAAAVAQFWVWVEDEIHKDMKLTEVEVADKLLDFRSKQAGFIDTSFDTISGISIPVTLMTIFFFFLF